MLRNAWRYALFVFDSEIRAHLTVKKKTRWGKSENNDNEKSRPPVCLKDAERRGSFRFPPLFRVVYFDSDKVDHFCESAYFFHCHFQGGWARLWLSKTLFGIKANR